MNKKMKSKKRDVFDDNSIKVPFVVPNITKSDKTLIQKALNSRLLTDGPFLKKFESSFAKFTGAKYAIGISNATSALHLSLKAIGIKKGMKLLYQTLHSLLRLTQCYLLALPPFWQILTLKT